MTCCGRRVAARHHSSPALAHRHRRRHRRGPGHPPHRGRLRGRHRRSHRDPPRPVGARAADAAGSTPSTSPRSSRCRCGVLGLGAAWLVERTDMPFRRVLAVGLVLPLAVPEYVAGYSWVSLSPRIQGLAGASFVMTLSLYPLVYLPIAASLRRSDPALDEVAQGLGPRAGHPLRAHHAAVHRPAAGRGDAPRGDVPPRRVRRLRHPALQDLRHGDLHAVHGSRFNGPGGVGPHPRPVPDRRGAAHGRVPHRPGPPPRPRVRTARPPHRRSAPGATSRSAAVAPAVRGWRSACPSGRSPTGCSGAAPRRCRPARWCAPRSSPSASAPLRPPRRRRWRCRWPS